MKYLYILALNSLLFTFVWICSYNYQLRTSNIEFDRKIAPSYRGTIDSKKKDIGPIWDKFTEEEKLKGVYEFKLRR